MAQLSTDKGLVYHLSTERLPSGSISKEVSNKVKGEKISEPEREMRTEEQAQKLAEVREDLRRRKIIK